MRSRQAQPPWSGLRTFFGAEHSSIDQVAHGDTVVIGVPSDTTSGSRLGSKYGPEALRDSSMELRSYFDLATEKTLYDIDAERDTRLRFRSRLLDIGDAPVFPSDIRKTAESVTAVVAAATGAGALPVILGGDHYITFPCFRGFAEGCQAGSRSSSSLPLGYMQIDAHMDLNTDNAIFGPHFHGSNARLIMQLENVAPRNVVWVGLRGLCQREHWDFIRTSGATAFTAKQVLRDGARQVARRAAEIASRGTDGIYVSIDIDVVDIAEAPGTGAIEFGGIAALDLLAIVDELSTCEKIRAVDLMEVAPNLDPSGVTQRLGVAALLGILRERLFEEY